MGMGDTILILNFSQTSDSEVGRTSETAHTERMIYIVKNSISPPKPDKCI